MKPLTLNDFLTEEQLKICTDLFKSFNESGESGFAQAVCDQVITPNLLEINEKIGQENNAKYLAYMVEYVLGQAYWSELH